ncbi:general substrate transporter [Dacryopinax primogenitus]|uniref:General substrate transporter n=1 Tax=Dacryopinax primogenitus (strain DJM 731) TaxID=1858805 RepID=M5FN96_DACPD|nr:general substrate transporter [Dacryopinax primogenitus]EJT97060.1 general substrate transporter [Dacryopinax primogenitus]
MVGHAPTSFERRIADVLPPRKGWWNYWYLWRLNFALLSSILSQATGGYDGSLLNGLQSLPLWTSYFNHPAGANLGVLNVALSIGQSVSTLIAGFLCDMFGRRIPLGIGCWLVIIGSVIGAAAANFGMFLGARILVGFGCGLQQVASSSLLAELSHPSQRVQVQTMFAPSYPLGGIVAAWVTYATYAYSTTWSWRLPLVLQAVFALLQFICLLFCPESPRWLIATGKRQKAIDVLVKHHANGDIDSPLVELEVAEIDSQIEADSIAKAYSWMEFFKTKGSRRRFYIMCFFPFARQFTGSNLISYFLPLVLNSVGITNSKEQLILNGGVNICAFLFGISAFLYVDYFGRRLVLILPMALCAASLVVWTILGALMDNSSNTGLGYGIVAMVFWFQGWIHVFDAAAEPYIQEMSTFALRSKIVVMWQFGQQVVYYISSFANPVAMPELGWRYIIIYAVLDAVYSLVMFLFFPETKGLSLEECVLVFDGEEGVERQLAAEKEFEQMRNAHSVAYADRELLNASVIQTHLYICKL